MESSNINSTNSENQKIPVQTKEHLKSLRIAQVKLLAVQCVCIQLWVMVFRR
jgi:hypothetical protein